MTFRIPVLPWALTLLLIFAPGIAVALWIAVFALAPGIGLLLVLTVVYAQALRQTITTFVLEVHVNGLVLYHVNRLVWADVTEARERQILFLPHLVLKRRRGMRWWVPLYFRGNGDIREVLRSASPAEHPIRHALA